MPELILNPVDLEDYLPHRGANMIIDEVWTNEDRSRSLAKARILPGDARGRDILLRTNADGVPCWYEPFLIELMALAGITQLHDINAPRGVISVFSMVSRIAFHRLAPAASLIEGSAELTRSRGDFHIFTTTARCDGQPLLEAEVMSGAAMLGAIAGLPRRPFTARPEGEQVDAREFAWKPAHLRFIDRVVGEDRAARSLRCSYVYPEDHPFTRGHFPGAPLMMGVTQWSAFADAAWLARCRFGIAGPVVANGVIKREDGSEVLDVRDLVLQPLAGPGGTEVPFIAATKRLAFRDVVRPGDGLLISVSVAPLAAPGRAAPAA